MDNMCKSTLKITDNVSGRSVLLCLKKRGFRKCPYSNCKECSLYEKADVVEDRVYAE